MSFAFDGNTIKLNQKDYERWKKAYKNILNLDAILQSRDDWLTYDAEVRTQERWYLSTSAYLAKQDAKAAQENRTDMAGRKLTREGHVQFKTHP